MTLLAHARTGAALRCGWVSHPGSGRTSNEDAVSSDLERGLFIISDGMGGQQAGELASRIVVTVLPSLLSREQELPPLEAFRKTVPALSRRLREETKGKAGLHGMGATLAAVRVRASEAFVAHLGDSRIHLLRGGTLLRLTQDHSLANALLIERDITPKEIDTHPARGSLVRYVGMEGDAIPDLESVAFEFGDRILLSSDGLTTAVREDRIAEVLCRSSKSPSTAAAELVQAALDAGTRDNVTALVVDKIR